jgi:hypothetical protein
MVDSKTDDISMNGNGAGHYEKGPGQERRRSSVIADLNRDKNLDAK